MVPVKQSTEVKKENKGGGGGTPRFKNKSSMISKKDGGKSSKEYMRNGDPLNYFDEDLMFSFKSK